HIARVFALGLKESPAAIFTFSNAVSSLFSTNASGIALAFATARHGAQSPKRRAGCRRVMKFPKCIFGFGLALLLLAGAGCSKQMATPASAALKNSDQAGVAAPFAKKDAANVGQPKSASGSLVPQEVVIPSGTAITVRLQNAVSSATSRPGDEFEATLDQPITVNGQTVAPEGTHVIGRVVAARHSGRLTHPGYLHIALSSVDVNGKA